MKGIPMRIRSLTLLALAPACLAGLAACTAATSSGPINTVTTPIVGKPAPPDSVEAALAHMPLYPYTILGQSDNDSLAPGESDTALGTACIAAAGYPGAQGMLGIAIRASVVGLGIAQDWGAWGYLGTADARQYGFLPTPRKALQELGINASPQSPSGASSTAEKDAIDKCNTIKFNFLDNVFNGPLAGINSIASAISKDLADDPEAKSATKAWAACMAKNGYNYATPQAAQNAQMSAISGGTGSVSINGTISPSVNSAQIAAAVTDANCTSSTDLAGIYFAAQASYEQQVVSANQTALAAAVQDFRSAYTREIGELPHLLATTKASPFPNAGKKVSSVGSSSSSSRSNCKGGPSSENAC
jgi:hypothetical protein